MEQNLDKDDFLLPKNRKDSVLDNVIPRSNNGVKPLTEKNKAISQNPPKQANIPFIDISQYILNESLSRQLPESYARKSRSILLAEEDNKYLVGMVNPKDIFATDELTEVLKKPLELVSVNEKDLIYKINHLYRRTNEITHFADKLATELGQITAEKETNKEEIKQADPAVIKLLNSLFADAVQVGASDIHIEPGEDILRIRLRVDGILQEQIISVEYKRNIISALDQRLKLMGGLNIAEKRLPQDGRFEISIHDIKLDVRLSTMPTQYGESIVMRLLNKSSEILDLDNTGMPPEILKDFRRSIKAPYGMILVTGPTGSGKTTTLFGALSEINDVTKNIVTIEDPIEYSLERVNQIQVKPKIGLTFANILRSVLRQDPNIILVGEIRDQETASIALRAALTGHLVFATLHTNDAASTAVRLIDIGVEDYLVAATVKSILAQRLARRICTHCQAPHQPTEEESIFFTNFFGEKFVESEFSAGKGCAYCNFTGYKGMVGIFELLELDDKMREALRSKNIENFEKTVDENRKSASLLGNAFEMARKKIISLSEVMRVAGEKI